MTRRLQTWTAWICLAAVGLTTAIVPRGAAGDSGLVLCVGCEKSALTISAPCTEDFDCCQNKGQHEDESGLDLAKAKDDGCGCMDVPFPSHLLPFSVHAKSTDHLQFLAYFPMPVYAIRSIEVPRCLVRHLSAVEPPWELVPSARATVLLI